MQDKYERLVDQLLDKEQARISRDIARGTNARLRARELERQAREFEREKAQAEYEYNLYRSAEIEFRQNPISDVPDEVKLPTFYFDDIANKVEYNRVYAEHYYRRYEETNLEKYLAQAERIRDCHKSWFGDHYKQSGVFNVKRVFHCHNRWCWLCTHLKQAERLYKYHIIFEKLLKEHDLYHIVFTIKNVSGSELKSSLARMQKSLKYMVRYFQCFKKIGGLDFAQYGWIGAIRSFEIIVNPTDYHPHLHVLFMLNKDLNFVRKNINKFSFDHGILKRKFSDFEILLQKMFYLLYNGIKVTEENITALPLGYSCTADCVEGDGWHEVFKYATKMSKYGASTASYEQFCLLDDILRKVKMYQGYGVFYNAEAVEPEKDPTTEILFTKVLYLLDSKEQPERDVHIELQKLVDEMHRKNMTVISKKMSYKYLKSIMDELRSELMIEDGFEPF